MDVQLQREKKFRRIKKEVEENGNLKAIQMVELRDAYGRDALGKHVVAGISRQRVRELTRAEEILDRVKAARDRRSWR